MNECTSSSLRSSSRFLNFNKHNCEFPTRTRKEHRVTPKDITIYIRRKGEKNIFWSIRVLRFEDQTRKHNEIHFALGRTCRPCQEYGEHFDRTN